MSAYDANTGDRQWVLQLGASLQSSPAIVNNVIYFGDNDHKLYAVNASTGSTICTFTSPGNISSSPVVVNPDGTGLVVYFGENGLTGADDGGAEFAINAVDPNSAADCSQKWEFTGFGSPPGSATQAGSWSPPAFGTDVNGRHLLVFGGSSPDCAVYAVDAVTGQLVWRFQTKVLSSDDDVGAGPTITPPGANGFADGVAYVAGKDNIRLRAQSAHRCGDLGVQHEVRVPVRLHQGVDPVDRDRLQQPPVRRLRRRRPRPRCGYRQHGVADDDHADHRRLVCARQRDHLLAGAHRCGRTGRPGHVRR